MPENENAFPSSVHSLRVSAAAVLVKSGAIPPGPSAMTASGGPTSVSTTGHRQASRGQYEIYILLCFSAVDFAGGAEGGGAYAWGEAVSAQA